MTNACPFLEAVNLLNKHFSSITRLIYSWESLHLSILAKDSNESQEEYLLQPVTYSMGLFISEITIHLVTED